MIPNSTTLHVERYDAAGPGKAGTIKLARASIGGHDVLFSDSWVKHAFSFTPSTAHQAEFNAIVAALSDGAQFLMPPANYGFSRKFAWLNDRFGVSWQVSFA